MDVSLLSRRYSVRCMDSEYIPAILALCEKNPLFYKHCPPFVTAQRIQDDMRALPPKKDYDDKYYIGYYDGGSLIAVMDLILRYPNDKTAFIGFFMVEKDVQGAGVGSGIVRELCNFLSGMGFSAVRLGWVRGNPQAAHFWHKNGFRETGITYDTEQYTVIVAQKAIAEKT